MFRAFERTPGKTRPVPPNPAKKEPPMFKATLAAAVILMAGAAQAATLVSPPFYLQTGDDYYCAVANGSTKPITSVVIDVTISGSTIGSGFHEDCGTLPDGDACEGDNEVGSAGLRYCSVQFTGSKTYVRALFCNSTKGICVPLQ